MGRIEGDLSAMSAADLIIWLGNRQKTGQLILSHGTQNKRIELEAGCAARAMSNDPREYLGQFLVNFGLVTEDQLTRAFQTQQETKVLLGRILVMIGTCSEEQVVKALEFQIRETLLNALPWREGRFTFEEAGSIERPPGDMNVRVPLVDIHHEGGRRAQHWEAIRVAFPSADMTLTVHESRVPAGMRPETFEGRILNLARAGLTIDAIKIDLHSTDFHFFARMFEMYRGGIIEPRETGPIQPFLESGPLPPGPHAELARQAFDKREYKSAMRHANAGLEDEPSDAALAELSLEAEQQHTKAVQAELPSAEAVPKLLVPLEDILERRISAKERYILTRIDGNRTIHNIQQISPIRAVEAAEIFARLAQEGLITF